MTMQETPRPKISMASFSRPAAADAFNEMCGIELQQSPLCDAKTPRMMRKALLKRRPPIDASTCMLKAWFAKHRQANSDARIANAYSMRNEQHVHQQSQEEILGEREWLRIRDAEPARDQSFAQQDQEMRERQSIEWEQLINDYPESLSDYPERRGIGMNRWMHAISEYTQTTVYPH